MKKILTLPLGGKLKLSIKTNNLNNVYFELSTINDKIISVVPVETLEGLEQLYNDITNRTMPNSLRNYLKTILEQRKIK
jgi:hypothetical protein